MVLGEYFPDRFMKLFEVIVSLVYCRFVMLINRFDMHIENIVVMDPEIFEDFDRNKHCIRVPLFTSL